MSMLSALSELAEVGLSAEKLELAVAESPEVRSAVIAKARQVQDYWKSLAPVGHGRPHDIYSAEEHNEPGTYRDSIHTEYLTTKSGAPKARVGAYGHLARWLEFGSIHNVEHGYGQRVANAFGAEVIAPGAKSEVLA
jgi:hypothetical protein